MSWLHNWRERIYFRPNITIVPRWVVNISIWVLKFQHCFEMWKKINCGFKNTRIFRGVFYTTNNGHFFNRSEVQCQELICHWELGLSATFIIYERDGDITIELSVVSLIACRLSCVYQISKAASSPSIIKRAGRWYEIWRFSV